MLLFNLMFETKRGVTDENSNRIFLRPENAQAFRTIEFEQMEFQTFCKEACDTEYQFPFGWDEINGTHNRTNFDLTRHQEYSGKSMEYFDEATKDLNDVLLSLLWL